MCRSATWRRTSLSERPSCSAAAAGVSRSPNRLRVKASTSSRRTIFLAPKVLALAEVVAGAALMALGLLWLAVSAARPRHLRRRFDVLALLLAVVALLEARRRP